MRAHFTWLFGSQHKRQQFRWWEAPRQSNRETETRGQTIHSTQNQLLCSASAKVQPANSNV